MTKQGKILIIKKGAKFQALIKSGNGIVVAKTRLFKRGNPCIIAIMQAQQTIKLAHHFDVGQTITGEYWFKANNIDGELLIHSKYYEKSAKRNVALRSVLKNIKSPIEFATS